jgi:D-aminopeptidase
MRARDIGIRIGSGRPGPFNAITDVPGVRVGHCTLVGGDGSLVVGSGPVRTGVTVVLPHDGNVWEEPVFAGFSRLNGNGELTGTHWIEESGMLKCAIGLTNSQSVGVVRDALAAVEIRSRRKGAQFWSLPVVGETWDGVLSDIHGQHVTREHVFAAHAAAAGGPVAEGNVGSGTGMICHDFKGGIGTSSRVIEAAGAGFTLGVLVQANQGARQRLQIDGVRVGEILNEHVVPLPLTPEEAAESAGSIIVLVATDAPLLPHQCTRLARRSSLGVGRVGGFGGNWSGDLMLAFATGNRGLPASDYGAASPLTTPIKMLSDTYIDLLFEAAVDATEEAIVNALLAAETMVGRDGVVAYALDPQRLASILAAWARTP